MVLISHPKEFIFFKTFKTGSTSAEGYFERYCLPPGADDGEMRRSGIETEYGVVGRRGWGKQNQGEESAKTWSGHIKARNVKRLLPDDVWQRYFKFCTIRNPFERTFSHFSMQHRELLDSGPSQAAITSAFKRWLETNESASYNLDRYMVRGEVVVDYMIQLENFAEGIKTVCEKLDIPFDESRIPTWRMNSKRKEQVGDWRIYYDAEAEAKVADIYAWEIERFDYRLG